MLVAIADVSDVWIFKGRDLWINIAKGAGRFLTSAGAGGLAALTAALIAFSVARDNRHHENYWEDQKLQAAVKKDNKEQSSRDEDRRITRDASIEDRDDARWWAIFQLLLTEGATLEKRSMSKLVQELSVVADRQGSAAKVAAVAVLTRRYNLPR